MHGLSLDLFVSRILSVRSCSVSSLRNTSSKLIASKSEFVSRRHQLANELARYVCRKVQSPSKHLVLIPSAEIQYMAYHIPYPFLQDSNFLYFTGLKDTVGVLSFTVLVEPDGSSDPKHRFEENLFVEVRTPKEELWDGPTLTESAISHLTGIRSTNPLKEFPDFLKYHSKHTNLWYSQLLDPEGDKRPVNKFVLSEVLKTTSDLRKSMRSPQPIIDELRFVKSDSEIQCLRHAASVTSDCLKEVMKVSHPGVNEAFLRDKLEFMSRIRGFSLGYPPVVAGGSRANIIHYLKSNQTIQDCELVLLDAGSRVEGYTADLTRTWPVNGHFSPVQRILYEILVETLKICSTSATPDRSLGQLHQLMMRELQRLLVNERIVPSSDSSTIIEKICPHHVGHFLGLDIHDTSTIPYSRRLQPGVVFPLEPGIYITPELENYGIPEEFIGIGMRLEDDFVISKNGHAEALTDELPRDPAAIEAIVQSKS